MRVLFVILPLSLKFWNCNKNFAKFSLHVPRSINGSVGIGSQTKRERPYRRTLKSKTVAIVDNDINFTADSPWYWRITSLELVERFFKGFAKFHHPVIPLFFAFRVPFEIALHARFYYTRDDIYRSNRNRIHHQQRDRRSKMYYRSNKEREPIIHR